MVTFTLEEEIEELQRELAIREKVYPRWIQEGKIKRDQAEKKKGLLKSTIARLDRELKKKVGEQLNLL
jgi:hypothetical protein